MCRHWAGVAESGLTQKGERGYGIQILVSDNLTLAPAPSGPQPSPSCDAKLGTSIPSFYHPSLHQMQTQLLYHLGLAVFSVSKTKYQTANCADRTPQDTTSHCLLNG